MESEGESEGTDYGVGLGLREPIYDPVQMSIWDYRLRRVIWHGEPVHLRPQELEIVTTLLILRGRAVNIDMIFAALWPNPDDEPETPERQIDVLMQGIKKKLPGLVIKLGEARRLGWVIARPDKPIPPVVPETRNKWIWDVDIHRGTGNTYYKGKA